MKPRSVRFALLALVGFAMAAAAPVLADTIYENGPINGTTDAWTINFGFVVSDTFTLVNDNTTVNGMVFGAWVIPGDTLTSVEVDLTSDEFGGTTYFDQVVSLTASNCAANQYGYDVCTETGTFHGPTLAAGTYWMSLGNADDPAGNPVYWDENSGIGCHSQGCPSEPSENDLGTIPAEAFTMLGNGGTQGSTPEPSSWLLMASGVMSCAGLLRRKLF